MQKYFCFVVIAVFVICVSGCGDNVKLKGKVTYSDDGSPLPQGTICFETSNFLARGEIQSDGTFAVSSTGKGDGLPKGTYSVYFSDMTILKAGERGAITQVVLVDPKFCNPTTSGLTCEVPYSSSLYEIQVDRPGTKNGAKK